MISGFKQKNIILNLFTIVSVFLIVSLPVCSAQSLERVFNPNPESNPLTGLFTFNSGVGDDVKALIKLIEKIGFKNFIQHGAYNQLFELKLRMIMEELVNPKYKKEACSDLDALFQAIISDFIEKVEFPEMININILDFENLYDAKTSKNIFELLSIIHGLYLFHCNDDGDDNNFEDSYTNNKYPEITNTPNENPLNDNPITNKRMDYDNVGRLTPLFHHTYPQEFVGYNMEGERFYDGTKKPPLPNWMRFTMVGTAITGLVGTAVCSLTILFSSSVAATATGQATIISLKNVAATKGGMAAAASVLGTGTLVINTELGAAELLSKLEEIEKGNYPAIKTSCQEMNGFQYPFNPTVTIQPSSLTGSCTMTDIVVNTEVIDSGYNSEGKFYVITNYKPTNTVFYQDIESLTSSLTLDYKSNGMLNPNTMLYTIFNSHADCVKGGELKVNYPYCTNNPHNLVTIKCDAITGSPTIGVVTNPGDGITSGTENIDSNPGTGGSSTPTIKYCNGNPDINNCPAYNDKCDVKKNEICQAQGGACKCIVVGAPPQDPDPNPTGK